MRRDQVMASRQLAGRVARWHTWPMIRKPTVAEHSARVATLYVELWGMPRAEVLYYCLCHDMGEFTAGDTPYSAKELAPGLREALNVSERIGLNRLGIELPVLTDKEFKRFKICDLLEMFETAVVEWNMGNRYAGCVVVDCYTAAGIIAEQLGELAKLINWAHANGYKGAHHYDVH